MSAGLLSLRFLCRIAYHPSRSIPFFIFAGVASAQINIAAANYNNDRTNVNPKETTLTPAAVAGNNFGKLGSFPVDGQIYAQPLYVSAVMIPGQGARNVVYAATMNNSVYAIDAGRPHSHAPFWQVNLGNAVPTAALPDLYDIDPQVGILSTPVIDAVNQVIYVVSETFEDGAPVFRLHGLSLADGHEMCHGPVVITATAPGSGSASIGGVITFDPAWHLQRPGLALANGAVYVAFGSHGDAGNYHGWVMAYSGSNLERQLAVFNATPKGNGGGIWQSGRAPAVDSSGNLYVVTGNGDFDGVSNFSGSVIKLSGSNLAVLDWYTPAAWQYLNDNDLDVGSVGAILVPKTQLLITGDKGGRVISLDRTALGHIESARGKNAVKVSPAGIFQLGLWAPSGVAYVFEHDWSGPLKAYPIGPTGISPTPASQNSTQPASFYQSVVISSNGSSGGIVWETTGDHAQPGVPGSLHAFDASDLSQELWNSDMQPDDVLGAFAKFALPLVADGRVYVPTFSNRLVVYGLKVAEAGSVPEPQIASVLNGASLLAGAVCPGEIVTILGVDLGPTASESFQVASDGSVAAQLGGTQVFFDGIPAPLLFTSSDQVSVVVPFEVASPATRMVVRYGQLNLAAASVPVVPAAPALFTQSGLGSGPAAISNEDASVNSASNPAAAGSIISLFATGLGPMTPVGQDGSVAGSVVARATLSVSVQIDGTPAEVLYAGSAPGLVEGVFQINVRIPPDAPSGPAVSISLMAGGVMSPSNTSVAIR